MRVGTRASENVTRQPPALGPSFTAAFIASRILPGDGNYRCYLNAGIIAMSMNGIALGEDPQSAAGPYARGNRR
jgi:hypothetical protein